MYTNDEAIEGVLAPGRRRAAAARASSAAKGTLERQTSGHDQWYVASLICST